MMLAATPEPTGLEVAALAVVWAGLSLYVLFGGADFGGGVWDLVASGPSRDRQRALVAEAIGPVWEANHVWLIFVLTGLLAAFPEAFAALGVSLYVPFSLAAVGIVFRGAAFAFRAHGQARSGWQRTWTRVFGVASLISPLVLGAAGASIASGRIRIRAGVVHADLIGAWTGPLSLTGAVLALAICAYLAATYLTVEAVTRRDDGLAEAFRARAIRSGIATGGLALLGLVVVRSAAPDLWSGMTHRGLPFVALSAIGGLGSLALMVRRRYGAARLAAVVAVGGVLWGWGAAQWPHLILPDLTAGEAAAPAATLRLIVAGYLIGGAILVPSLFALFRVFKAARTGTGGG